MSAMGSRMLSMTFVLASGLIIGAMHAAGVPASDAEAQPEWSEISWPFPFDAWAAGRAFRCAAPACATEMSVYVRPKIGFCNCSVGVADDDEIDRVGDVYLVGEPYRALEPGKAIAIGDMKGRARPFVVPAINTGPRYVIGAAVARTCNAVVVTVVAAQPITAEMQRAAFAFLSGDRMVGWATASVGAQ